MRMVSKPVGCMQGYGRERNACWTETSRPARKFWIKVWTWNSAMEVLSGTCQHVKPFGHPKTWPKELRGSSSQRYPPFIGGNLGILNHQNHQSKMLVDKHSEKSRLSSAGVVWRKTYRKPSTFCAICTGFPGHFPFKRPAPKAYGYGGPLVPRVLQPAKSSRCTAVQVDVSQASWVASNYGNPRSNVILFLIVKLWFSRGKNIGYMVNIY